MKNPNSRSTMNRMVFWMILLLLGITTLLAGQSAGLARLTVEEPAGLAREGEYVEFTLQLPVTGWEQAAPALAAVDPLRSDTIPVQVFDFKTTPDGKTALLRAIFPLRIAAGEKREFTIISAPGGPPPAKQDAGKLSVSGEDTELIVENAFYRADLTRNPAIEPQSHPSGQIRSLLIKMGFDQLLTNAEDRLHWAPNFKRPELEYYTTIAHWENPGLNRVDRGPYLVRTVRQDYAPAHPEILLTAVYKFYRGQPYFRFYSGMEFREDLWLALLRNDEMTMDSMFTHLAFERPGGQIVDITFEERHELLEKQPIENDAPWICFYNADRGFAFGSIRINYDNRNVFGQESPTFRPHTQIGEWLAGIKYWNRRLVHDQLTFIPKGSRYQEENVYLVFRIGAEDRFQPIRDTAARLRQPLRVTVGYSGY